MDKKKYNFIEILKGTIVSIWMVAIIILCIYWQDSPLLFICVGQMFLVPGITILARCINNNEDTSNPIKKRKSKLKGISDLPIIILLVILFGLFMIIYGIISMNPKLFEIINSIKHYIIGSIFTLLGILLISRYPLKKIRYYIKYSKKVEAVLTEYLKNKEIDWLEFTPAVYKYEIECEEYKYVINLYPDDPKDEIGEKIELRVNPKNPSDVDEVVK